MAEKEEVEHRMVEAGQLVYPGGKNGWWQARCTCGYSSGARYTKQSAVKSLIEHLLAVGGPV